MKGSRELEAIFMSGKNVHCEKNAIVIFHDKNYQVLY